VPDGTTSYYYRTREALLRGVGQRVADIDLVNIASVSAESTRTGAAPEQGADRADARRRARSRTAGNAEYGRDDVHQRHLHAIVTAVAIERTD